MTKMLKNFNDIASKFSQIEMAARFSLVETLVNALKEQNVKSMTYADPITIDLESGDYGLLDSFRISKDEESGVDTLYVTYIVILSDGSEYPYEDRNMLKIKSTDISNFAYNILYGVMVK